MNVFGYLLSVSACTGIFFIFYRVLLSRTTFFTWNRWYLVISLVVSFGIPLITIPVTSRHHPVFQREHVIQIAKAGGLHDYNVPRDIPVAKTLITPMQIAEYAYFAVTFFLLIKLVISVVLLLVRLNRCKRIPHGNGMVLKSGEGLSNGSFFRYIFIDDTGLTDGEAASVIEHERIHVVLGHSADKLLVQIVRAILWFNPFSYFYQNAITENHEFEADRILTGGTDKAAYAELILSLGSGVQSRIYNEFSMPAVKKRILTLFRKPTNHMKKLIYLLALPVTAFSCFAFSDWKVLPADNQKSVLAEAKLNLPAPIQAAMSKIDTQGILGKEDTAVIKRRSTDKQQAGVTVEEPVNKDSLLDVKYTASDSIRFSTDGKVIVLFGKSNVKFSNGNNWINVDAGRITINNETMTLSAQGEVYDSEKKNITGRATITIQSEGGQFDRVKMGGKGHPEGTRKPGGNGTFKADTILLNMRTLKGKSYGAVEEK